MLDYSLKELKYWNEKIEDLVRSEGLICFSQEFELVSYEEMIAYEAYAGMPSHYPHWSYGKAYERIRTLNRYNIAGLPYEMVINSNPCIAYLMKDNSLLLQIMTMAHVYGHNDFFRNNRLFTASSKAEYAIEMFKSHGARVREYISDPSIGYEKVERVLNAAHALRYQTELLCFIGEHGKISDWERDIIDIVREETDYFIPQIETKIINEGWASFWHAALLKKLKLPQHLHFEFLKRHNQLVKPYEGRINPYFLGFKIFEDIYEKNQASPGKIFEVREIERDASFVRRYLTSELCRELKLYEYKKDGNEYVVTEVADEAGWIKIRNNIADYCGLGNFPIIKAEDWNQKDNTLLLEHIYDGRELDMTHTKETLKHLADLWDGRIMLNTRSDDNKMTILCDEQKRIVQINR